MNEPTRTHNPNQEPNDSPEILLGFPTKTGQSDKASPSQTDHKSQSESFFGSNELPVIEGYEIYSEINRGGMGRVLAAREIELDREVAIKILLPGADPRRFLRESKITAKLPHPCIPPVYAIGRLQNGSLFLSMKRIEGQTLGDLLKLRNEKKVDLPNLIQIFERICEAVGFAHTQGILHRDLKPNNVMVGKFGEVLVMDWGLAKLLEGTIDLLESDDSLFENQFVVVNPSDQQTRTGSVLGTPAYMAPEQARGEEVDRRADVFGLGAILTTILTGIPVFSAPTTNETLQQAASGQTQHALNRLAKLNAEPELIEIARDCLQVNPDMRPKDGQAVAERIAHYRADAEKRLRDAEAERMVVLAKAHEQQKRQRMIQIAIGVVAIIFGIGGVGTMAGFLDAKAAKNEEFKQREIAEKQGKEASIQRDIADEKTKEALTQKKLAELKTEEAKQNLVSSQKNEQEALVQKQKAEERLYRAESLVYASKLAQAIDAFESGNGAAALQHLHSCQWNLQGWEYRHLLARFNSRVTFTVSSEGIYQVSISPDGSKILASRGLHAVVLDAVTGEERLRLPAHTDELRWLTFSPDGTRILTGSYDRTCRIHDAQNGKQLVEYKGHSGPITSLVFSPDGKYVASGSFDKTVQVWNSETGEGIHTFKEHEATVYNICFSSDGKEIFSVGGPALIAWNPQNGEKRFTKIYRQNRPKLVAHSPDEKHIYCTFGDNQILVLDAKTGDEVRKMTGHANTIQSLVLQGNGKQFAIANIDGSIEVWDTEKAEILFRLLGHTGPVFGLAYSHDGRRLISSGADGLIKLWDTEHGQSLKSLDDLTSDIRAICYSPDGNLLAVGDSGGIRFWDSRKGIWGRKLVSPPRMISQLEFSSDGKFLVSATRTEFQIWEVESGRLLSSVNAHSTYCQTVSFSPDGQRVVTGGNENFAKIWDVKQQSVILTLKGHNGPISIVKYSADGKWIITTSQDRLVKIWDAQTGDEIRTLHGHRDQIMCLDLSTDRKHILTTSHDKLVRLWDAQNAEELQVFRHPDLVYQAYFHPNRKQIVTGGSDQLLRFWDLKTGLQTVALKGANHRIDSIAISPNGEQILTAGPNKVVRLWDAKPMLITAQIEMQDTTYAAAFSPDGKFLLIAGEDRVARVFDWLKGEELLHLKGHTERIQSVAYSPDGERIVTGSHDRTAKVWNAKTGELLFTLRGNRSYINSVEYSPDGKTILTAGQDGTIRVWNAETGQEITMADGTPLFGFMNSRESFLSTAFSSDGRWIASGGNNGRAIIWDAQKYTVIHRTKGHKSSINRVQFSPDSQYLVTCGYDKIASIWDVNTGREVRSLKTEYAILSASYNPSGKQLLTVGQNGNWTLWDTTTGEKLRHGREDMRFVNQGVFHPSGKHFVTVGMDRKIKIWQAHVGESIQHFLVAHLQVTHVAFDHDEKHLYAWDTGQNIHAWNLSSGAKIEPIAPPNKGETGPKNSLNGYLRAEARGTQIEISDIRKPDKNLLWSLPNLEERKMYHEQQATLYQRLNQPFAEIFHLKQLLREFPENTKYQEKLNSAHTRLKNLEKSTKK